VDLILDLLRTSEYGTWGLTKRGNTHDQGRALHPHCLTRFNLQICHVLLSYAFPETSFAGAVNVAALFLTNSWTVRGSFPVSIRTSSDIRSYRPARCRSAI